MSSEGQLARERGWTLGSLVKRLIEGGRVYLEHRWVHWYLGQRDGPPEIKN